MQIKMQLVIKQRNQQLLRMMNVPNHSGNSVSKNLLCKYTTIHEIINAPIIPISRVLILVIIVRPLVPPVSAAKSTPKVPPHWLKDRT